MMNQRLLNKVVQDQTKLTSQMRAKLNHQALVNEYMYMLMQKHGVSVRIDERIGVEFIDVRRMTEMTIDVVSGGNDQSALLGTFGT